ncbi:uncharacterized protein Hap1MRO34_014404 isoform 2-T2 [Clarias gariepinus]
MEKNDSSPPPGDCELPLSLLLALQLELELQKPARRSRNNAYVQEDLLGEVLIYDITIQRLTLKFTAVIEKSCRHVCVGPQERLPLQQSRGVKDLEVNLPRTFGFR